MELPFARDHETLESSEGEEIDHWSLFRGPGSATMSIRTGA